MPVWPRAIVLYLAVLAAAAGLVVERTPPPRPLGSAAGRAIPAMAPLQPAAEAGAALAPVPSWLVAPLSAATLGDVAAAARAAALAACGGDAQAAAVLFGRRADMALAAVPRAGGP